ncbi:stage II sporulation protein D [Sporolactobacillus kofuensis]|uniref:Stage II sporulation protein D n=1 Tax=Sporolactobacillus kofuensis TaxID=269672 RepID=A0ABW1WHC1_9BACL|nr:stage II sporulation protein D [Sporolactobacillus kofuensis]MCO7176328.1 stage II sporulation protein D [Sporolactobacillus kofuensis]
MKKAIALLFIFVLIIIIIPAVVVIPYTHQVAHQQTQKRITQDQKTISKAALISVSVYRSADKRVDQVALNDYLIGVVGSEMPAKFRLEALKAQAIAARTYIMARIMENPNRQVTDTVQNQVYHSRTELKKIWGNDYHWKIKKVTQAVAETDAQVITYKGKLISPVFFSTSNGQTENAKDYWSNNVPYLKSVPSPWDKLSPKYRIKKKLRTVDVERALDVRLGSNGDLGKVLKKTATNHIALYRVDGKIFTGRQIREKLKLSSTDFQLIKNGNQVIAQTLGSGHDVGMSQYGAEGMAREGKSAKQIITYFYQGTQLSKMTVKAQQALAKK